MVQAAELRERELEAEAVVKYEQREKDFTVMDVETSGGFHSHGDTPIAGWFIVENPSMNGCGGYPHFRNPPMWKPSPFLFLKRDMQQFVQMGVCDI